MSAGGGPLWLVRHAHTVLHGTDGIAGRRDVALSDEGRAAARALGAALARHVAADGEAPARWFSSPSGRARGTAGTLRAAIGHAARPLAIDDRLVELDFGDWEGSGWGRVHRQHGAALARWGEGWIERGPPNGESFRAQTRRCAAWYADAFGERRLDTAGATGVSGADGADGGASVVVTHGGCVRALLCLLLDRPLAEAPRFVVEPASVYRLERGDGGEGRWRLVGANLAAFD